MSDLVYRRLKALVSQRHFLGLHCARTILRWFFDGLLA